ncbi:MAG: 50S ribosomal protein L22 [Deltaproteobacteria bacterium]|nr:50S ribosomal protein L22 [Deltaproteobacteria bacterium]MDL1971771.1 50S ribosomal protein L22 [Deltaproteobacteria bacterium]
MEVKAVAKYVRISPRKVRLVIDLVRGKRVDESLNILQFTPKRAAHIVRKLIKSAIANAEQKPDVDIDNLYIKYIYADEGPTLKRYRARALGRAVRIRRRTSHITVVLDEILE